MKTFMNIAQKQIQMSKTILGKGNPSAKFIKIVLGNKNLLDYIDKGATLCFGRKFISRNWEIFFFLRSKRWKAKCYPPKNLLKWKY
jgi:hypothetical protein